MTTTATTTARAPGSRDRSAAGTAGHEAGRARTPRGTGLALLVLSAVQLLLVVDISIVNVGLASLQRDLGVEASVLPWVVTAYSLSYGGLLLLGGRAGDVLGRRRTLMAGVLVFGAGSVAAGAAATASVVLAARAVQGVGAALAAPAVLGLIGATFPEPARRARAMAVYAAMSGAGAALGLVGGGLLVQYVSWRSVFLINVPVVLAILVLAPRALAETPRQRSRLPLVSALAATGASSALLLALTRAGSDGWSDGTVAIGLVVAVLLVLLLVVAERRADQPLLPARVLSDRRRLVAFAVSAVLGGTLLSLLFLTTQFGQVVQGGTPVLTGLSFLPFSAAMVLTSQLVGRGPARLRTPRSGALGLLVVAAGVGGLTALAPETAYVWGVLLPLVVAGVGVGLVFVPLTLAATRGVAPADLGVAGGVLSASQVLGGALGVAAVATITAGSPATPVGLTAGYVDAFTALAVALVATAVLALLAWRRRD